jgi:deoxyadenosine/deoxycytidine kinase
MASKFTERALTVCIEGNIASGKTTILEYLKRFKTITVLPEKVEDWCHFTGNTNQEGANLLKLFYEDQKQYAYQFQSLVLLTQYENHMQVVGTPIKIMERSIHSSLKIFGQLLKDNGNLTNIEFGLLTKLYEHLQDSSQVSPDAYIFLDTPPVASRLRLEKRGRPEEQDTEVISVDYLTQISDLYEQFVASQVVPVIRIDGIQEKARVVQDVIEVISNFSYSFLSERNDETS